MILVDGNLLIYARSASFQQHEAARNWLDSQLNRHHQRVALPWPSLLAFLRILSHPKIVERPESVSSLWKQVEDWLALPGVWIPSPTERHADCLSLLLPHATRSDLLPDAHLAALAMEYGLKVCSTDGDFARFPNLSWENPIA